MGYNIATNNTSVNIIGTLTLAARVRLPKSADIGGDRHNSMVSHRHLWGQRLYRFFVTVCTTP